MWPSLITQAWQKVQQSGVNSPWLELFNMYHPWLWWCISYLHRLFQSDFACSLNRVHSVLVYVCTRYLSNSITPPQLIHCYTMERCHWVSWPLHNMADWTGKLEVPVPLSTRGCNKYLLYILVYIWHIKPFLSDQKYM